MPQDRASSLSRHAVRKEWLDRASILVRIDDAIRQAEIKCPTTRHQLRNEGTFPGAVRTGEDNELWHAGTTSLI